MTKLKYHRESTDRGEVISVDVITECGARLYNVATISEPYSANPIIALHAKMGVNAVKQIVARATRREAELCPRCKSERTNTGDRWLAGLVVCQECGFAWDIYWSLEQKKFAASVVAPFQPKT